MVRELAGDGDFELEPIEHSHFTDGDYTGIEVRWTLVPDQRKPDLDVIWTPPKGTKVKPGDKITAKVTARDDATPAQTGVARVRVDVGIGGGLVAPAAQYPPPMPLQECGRQNPVRTYEATYTVPASPPVVVQLRAYARDFAGNEIWQDAEFPTGGWKGTIEWSQLMDGKGHKGSIDVSFSPDASGNLKGTATSVEELVGPPCPLTFPVPARMTANVGGQYTPGQNVMSLRFEDAQKTTGTFTCSGQRGQYYPIADSAALLLSGLQMNEQGSVDATREGPAGALRLRVNVKLRRAEN